ncbi:aminotransferase class III-fold pyridoxal phosphate-dependent enzyme [Amycolatopsis samaneae]|uniref:Aminotransferase class III-fold pyridoxal phosphate-dependent enzyme n=1 Tax=Amycolatopsis samaneae TaxID=664691 RepID=A0ABW5GU36_9PSEU
MPSICLEDEDIHDMNQSPSLPIAAWAEGCYIYDTNGKEYLDGSSGPIAVNIGHGVPEVLEAMSGQAKRIVFTYRTQFASQAVLDLTAEILGTAGKRYREVVYTNSGSEATEAALRLVMHHHQAEGDTGRTAILSQIPSYHGMTAGALATSGHPGRREHLRALHDHSASVVPVAAGGSEHLLPGIAEWEAAFASVGAHRIAAVVLEPVGGAAGGAAVVPDEVFRRIEELCRASGALLVADEVMTGFGRTGAWFGHEHAGVTPDIVITGKGLSGGYTPIGACLVGDRVLPGRSAADLAFGHTMSGNPLSAATALAVLRYTREHRLAERAARTGATLRDRLATLAERFSFLGRPRGRGLLLAVPVLQHEEEFRRDPLARRICRTAQRLGLIVYPAGVSTRSQAVLVAPPLTIKENEIDELLLRLARTLDTVRTEAEQGKVAV